ncbi:nuclear transport factor 2 family protein [Acaryochloris sp. IP29b_bin.137]|uniref:nuclear transport factor 2 family protein n=1 Tax=Acaryochloris sp. IP29b_bin.137 TaxID=2969217 RepID=UPI0026206FA2|nr:nuclear transport factor 2 family protein [Acaryochloris sp. IP29b_bin.137]
MTLPAHLLIQAMYEAINERNVAKALECIDPNCCYQDLNFVQPFQGKAAVEALFTESCQGMPADLRFVVDDITEGDALAVGVLWHVELGGIPLPNGRGVSFCRLSEETGKLIFARDLVEPVIKPGKGAFFILRLIAPLIRLSLKPTGTAALGKTTSHTANPTDLPSQQPWLSRLLWLLAGAYIYILFLSPPGQIMPGEPVWAIQAETWQEVLNESLNFFFILPLVNALGIHYLEAPLVHPVDQAFFNVVIAWIFIFLPLLLADVRSRKLPKVAIWSMALFLTNAFMIPYMAMRAAMPLPEAVPSPSKGLLARIFGWTGLLVSGMVLFWFGFVGPEFGTVAERLQYFGTQLTTNRVSVAFCVDLVFFTLFQIVLLGAVEPNPQKRWLRFIPFWGLVTWLII